MAAQHLEVCDWPPLSFTADRGFPTQLKAVGREWLLELQKSCFTAILVLWQTTQLHWLPLSLSLLSHYSHPAFLALSSSVTASFPCSLLACFCPCCTQGRRAGKEPGQRLVTAGVSKLLCKMQENDVGDLRHTHGCYLQPIYVRMFLSWQCAGGSSLT